MCLGVQPMSRSRERAAAFLGISVHGLKRLMAAGNGPVCVKNGETRQATALRTDAGPRSQ